MAGRRKSGKPKSPPPPRDPVTGRFPKGNGRSFYGDANGASTSRLREKGDPYSDAIRALSHDPAHAEHKMSIAAEAFAVPIEIMRDAEHPERLAASREVTRRLLGEPEKRMTLAGDADRPVVMVRKFFQPPESEA